MPVPDRQSLKGEVKEQHKWRCILPRRSRATNENDEENTGKKTSLFRFAMLKRHKKYEKKYYNILIRTGSSSNVVLIA